MFTGIVTCIGEVVASGPSPAGARLVVRYPMDAWGGYRPAFGDSIAVNGCCLTLATPLDEVGAEGQGKMAFDAIPETLGKTTLGSFVPGTRVNLEHAASAGTLLGGHVVQGHIDGVGVVERVESAGEWRVRVRSPETVREYLVPKGSVCVDGVSLTLARVEPREGWFEVALIPTTLEKTTLAGLRTGSRVNIEADAMAKTVVHYLRHFVGHQTVPGATTLRP